MYTAKVVCIDGETHFSFNFRTQVFGFQREGCEKSLVVIIVKCNEKYAIETSINRHLHTILYYNMIIYCCHSSNTNLTGFCLPYILPPPK